MNTAQAKPTTTLSHRHTGIAQRRKALERRLEDGYQRIEQALGNGEDVRAWEDFWLQLLAEYESVCGDLREAA